MTTKRRMVILCMLALCLLAGGALAADEGAWGYEAFIQGSPLALQTIDPRQLNFVQQVGQTFANDMLRVTVVDALWDGYSLTVTWIMENLADMPICVASNPVLSGNGLQGSASTRAGINGTVLQPQEIMHSGFTTEYPSTDFPIPVSGEGYTMALQIATLLPNDTFYDIYYEPILAEGDTEAIDAFILALQAEGKIAYARDGLWLDSGFYNYADHDASMADILVASGKMRLADTLDCAFTVTRADFLQSALTSDAPIRQDFGDFAIQVNKAELRANSLLLEIDVIYPDMGTARRRGNLFPSAEEPYVDFEFTDDRGQTRWYSGSNTDATGKWQVLSEGGHAMTRQYLFTNLNHLPETIAIQPTAPSYVHLSGYEYTLSAWQLPTPENSLTLTFQ